MKRAIITGATTGIGRAIAEAMWQEGYSLAVCARTHEDLIAMADVFQPKEEAQQFLWRTTDLSESGELLAFCELIRHHWSTVDVLVNNAGIFVQGGVLTEDDGVLESMMKVNMYSVYHLTRKMLPLLQQSDQGHVFNMCSVASIKAYPNGGSYAITKSALLGFSRNLREETKRMGIKVTTVIAGATWSDSWAGVDYPEDRLMPAKDIAEAVMSALRMGPISVVEEILIRPQLGDL